MSLLGVCDPFSLNLLVTWSGKVWLTSTLVALLLLDTLPIKLELLWRSKSSLIKLFEGESIVFSYFVFTLGPTKLIEIIVCFLCIDNTLEHSEPGLLIASPRSRFRAIWQDVCFLPKVTALLSFSWRPNLKSFCLCVLNFSFISCLIFSCRYAWMPSIFSLDFMASRSLVTNWSIRFLKFLAANLSYYISFGFKPTRSYFFSLKIGMSLPWFSSALRRTMSSSNLPFWSLAFNTKD